MYYLTLRSYYLGDLTLYLTVSITYLLITYTCMQCSAVQVDRQAGRQAGIRTSIRAGHIVLLVHTYTTSIENSAT